ncbi:hypothetical protein BaRGS_00015176 [Batillaria attramentaria]|uniref:Uncharacterized protein n=1 Tax=Batillaria attramentaria TaxID=370345 RepID=A0ABD0L2E7_9CAEN
MVGDSGWLTGTEMVQSFARTDEEGDVQYFMRPDRSTTLRVEDCTAAHKPLHVSRSGSVALSENAATGE